MSLRTVTLRQKIYIHMYLYTFNSGNIILYSYPSPICKVDSSTSHQQLTSCKCKVSVAERADGCSKSIRSKFVAIYTVKQ